MKRAWFIAFLTYSALSAAAQPKASLLTTPTKWQFEQFSLPPDFAPAVTYHGQEELRFSPGWNKKNAADYFTVIWGFRFDDTKGVSEADIKSFLLTYFRGLCSSTTKSRHLSSVDTSAITVEIRRVPAIDKSQGYNVILHLFGVFADGSPVTLLAELKVLEDADHRKAYLFMIASSKAKTNPVWEQLHKEFRAYGMR